MSDSDSSASLEASAAGFKLIDDREAEELIHEAIKSMATAVVWTKNQEVLFKSRMTHVNEDIDQYTIAPPNDQTTKRFEDSLNDADKKDVFFSLSTQRANYFFKTIYTHQDTDGLVFEVPDEIYKVQRRKEFRIPITDKTAIQLEFPDPLVSGKRLRKRVIDISAGGLAVVVDDDDGPNFHNGMRLDGASFSINGRKIPVDVEVRYKKPHVSDVPNKKELKIGFMFHNLRPADVQVIATFVFEESRRYFSKFIFK